MDVVLVLYRRMDAVLFTDIHMWDMQAGRCFIDRDSKVTPRMLPMS